MAPWMDVEVEDRPTGAPTTHHSSTPVLQTGQCTYLHHCSNLKHEAEASLVALDIARLLTLAGHHRVMQYHPFT